MTTLTQNQYFLGLFAAPVQGQYRHGPEWIRSMRRSCIPGGHCINEDGAFSNKLFLGF